MRIDSGEDILYCDYGYDSDAASYDVLFLTASASLQDVHKDIVFHAKLSNAWLLAEKFFLVLLQKN